ncbi:MAG TPA: glycosyltransferase family 4 protein [Candidatus Nanoarchaeia archaeon]|nr:glycosyltransferase family 4 protein [Candidatus Nanoarchaeia archaeon]
MRILELTNYTAGGCGVGARVLAEAELLAERGHEVVIFSSNQVKGTREFCPLEDRRGKVLIRRFLARRLGGESYLSWDFYKEALAFKPEVIIAHAYRHSHTIKALKIAKKLSCKVFLVTHAPFLENDKARGVLSRWAVRWYDGWVGPSRKLNEFTKVIAITKWELPFLEKLGVRKDKIAYIPNGIPSLFFTQKKVKERKKILFLGRLAPIKKIETLLEAVALMKEKIEVDLVGPEEPEYGARLREKAEALGIQERVRFFGPLYDMKQKITMIDSSRVFVLPSQREAMPQALIEAMARGKLVVASSNPGSRDIIIPEKNGFLFEVGNVEELAGILQALFEKEYARVRKEAVQSVRQFSWDLVINKLERVISGT